MILKILNELDLLGIDQRNPEISVLPILDDNLIRLLNKLPVFLFKQAYLI